MSANRCFTGVCRRCARRGWLLSRLGQALDALIEDPTRLWATLELHDQDLIAALAGDEARRAQLLAAWEDWPADYPWAQSPPLGDVRVTCRHHCQYPQRLRDDPLAPHALAALGHSKDSDAPDCPMQRKVVAIAGASSPSSYGIRVARALAAELAAAGVTIAGSDGGIGTAARAAAVAAGGRALHVAGAGACERPAVRTRAGDGCQWRVCEPVVQAAGGRWLEVAAERTLALLADLVLVPQAHEEDRLDLACAEVARSRGIPVAVVPGPIDLPASRGSNRLLVTGARLICNAREALDPLFGVGAVVAGSGHLR